MNSLKTLRTRWKISDLENIFRTGTGEVMSVSHRSLCTNITQYRHIQQLQRKNKSYDLQLNNGGLEKADFQQRRYNLAKLLASSNPVLHIPRATTPEPDFLQREHFVLIPSAQRSYMVKYDLKSNIALKVSIVLSMFF